MPSALWVVIAFVAAAALAGPLGYYVAIRNRLSPLIAQLAKTEERLKAAEAANLEIRTHFDEVRKVSEENTALKVELAGERVARAAEVKAYVEVSKWKEMATEESTARQAEERFHNSLLEARVVAAESRARLLAEQDFKKRFRIEKEYNTDTDGFIFKSDFLVVNERILFDERPITPWIPTRRKLKSRLDKDELKAVVEATTALANSFMQIAPHALPKAIKNVASSLASTLKGADGETQEAPTIVIDTTSISEQIVNVLPPPDNHEDTDDKTV
jgi:hypothetical protein